MLMSLFKKLSVAVLCNVCFQELALTEPTPGSWLSQQLPCEECKMNCNCWILLPTNEYIKAVC